MPDWEGWLAVFALLHAAGVLRLLGGGNDNAPILIAVWFALFVAAFALLCYDDRLRWLVWMLRRQPLLCALLIMATASWFWSIAPEFTWSRSILLVGTTLIGVYIGYRFSPPALMVILFHTFAFLVVGGVLAALLSPGYGRTFLEDGHVWIGLAVNRNHFGFVATIAAVFFLVGSLFGRIPPLLGSALALLSVLALVMTGSATAIVALVVGVITVVIFMLSKWIRAPSILTLILVLAAGTGAALLIATTDYVYDFTDALNRSPTFTGRTQIWAAAWQATLDRPWLGWGYGALWSTSADSAFVQRQLLGIDQLVAHAHNSFLNVASELGIPAGIAAIGYLLVVLLQATRAYIRRASPFVLFAIALGFMVTVESVAEARLLERRQFFWILFVAIAIAVQWALPAPRRRAPGRP